MESNKKEIRDDTRHLILAEGKDAYYFLVHLLTYNINNKNNKDSVIATFNTFQVFDFDGNSNLNKLLNIILLSEKFPNITSLSVIRDAENNHESAASSIKQSFTKFDLPPPNKPFTPNKDGDLNTGFILFPDCSSSPRNGTLEDLCLEILYNKYFKQISEAESIIKGNNFKRPHKNKLHLCFSLTDEFVSLKIGEAAKARAFNFESPQIISINSFLLDMAAPPPGNQQL
ncbi:MAG: hypothetical protein LBT47_10505 [Deltaproteobacteria bacterium]|jgi:hypothetical protein|nr:hypothetical protein [Deltaproteobacteria bacterium]